MTNFGKNEEKKKKVVHALSPCPVELEKEIWLKNKLKNGIGLDFVRYRSQNLTQPIFQFVFQPNFLFKP